MLCSPQNNPKRSRLSLLSFYERGNYADAYEAVARVDYKYSKKLNFKAWYSYIDRDNTLKDDKHLRFEARYNF